MLTIYGTSDDLIEIEGDIREEFSHYPDGDEPAFLAFSDGTLLSVVYSKEGIWRFDQVAQGSATYGKVEGTDDDNYSDRVTLTGEIGWVVMGDDMAKATKEKAKS